MLLLKGQRDIRTAKSAHGTLLSGREHASNVPNDPFLLQGDVKHAGNASWRLPGLF